MTTADKETLTTAGEEMLTVDREMFKAGTGSAKILATGTETEYGPAARPTGAATTRLAMKTKPRMMLSIEVMMHFILMNVLVVVGGGSVLMC